MTRLLVIASVSFKYLARTVITRGRVELGIVLGDGHPVFRSGTRPHDLFNVPSS